MNDYYQQQFRTIDAAQTTPELQLFLAHSDGYVRQAAIARAVTLAHADLLVPVAERLNDWVPQVRDAARAAIVALLPLVPTLHVLGILPKIERLRTAPRSDHRQWLIDFERALLVVVDAGDLVAGANGADVSIARACFYLLQRHTMVDATTMVSLGLRSRRDIVMSMRAALFIGMLPVEQREIHYRATLNSHFGAVRTVGIRALLSQPKSPALHQLALSMLLDPQSSVRSAAIRYLRSDAFDVAAFYRNLLEAPSTTSGVVRTCLGALAGLRSNADLSLLKTFLASPLISIRTSAYAAWLKIEPNDKDAIAEGALADEAKSIRKAALDMTRRQGAFIAFDTVCAVLTRHQEWHALLRFSQREKWIALEAIARIALATGPSHPVRAELKRELAGWMQVPGSFTRPTQGQLEFLRAEETTEVLLAMAPPGISFPHLLERELLIALGRRT